MSRGRFNQPSSVDACVKAHSWVGGFRGDFGKAFDWAAFDDLMRSSQSSSHGPPACGMAKVRSLGLDRNNRLLQLVVAAMNMKRTRALLETA